MRAGAVACSPMPTTSAPATSAGQLPATARPRGCRVVTTALSARLLLAGQLKVLDDVEWSVLAGDEFADPPDDVTAFQVRMGRELGPSDVVSLVRLYRFFRRHRFHFVQTHTPKASLLALPAARLAGLPTLYTMHGSLYFRDNSRLANLAGWAFERWCCAWADRVLLQSEEDLGVMAAARICPEPKLVHVGNGIRLERFPEVPPPGGRPRPVVLMVSRLVVEKGCRDFLRVAEMLRGRADFVHVGPVEPDQRDALSEGEIDEAAERGLVRFVGPVDDVRPFLADADLVLLPSYREGIPRAAMEAAATGRPVAGYDVRGVREVLPPGSGLLVARGDVASLAAVVAELVDRPERRTELGRACREHVAARFDEDLVVARLRQVYAEVPGVAS